MVRSPRAGPGHQRKLKHVFADAKHEHDGGLRHAYRIRATVVGENHSVLPQALHHFRPAKIEFIKSRAGDLQELEIWASSGDLDCVLYDLWAGDYVHSL